jgi:hypothetical protein
MQEHDESPQVSKASIPIRQLTECGAHSHLKALLSQKFKKRLMARDGRHRAV